jgi:hypothetical protein
VGKACVNESMPQRSTRLVHTIACKIECEGAWGKAPCGQSRVEVNVSRPERSTRFVR